jgi:enamine deaminase RidA (YjgF/YER057c/UK114 family)
MSEMKPVLPEGWARGRGYSHAITTVGQKWVFVAGQLPAVNAKFPIEAGLDMGKQFALALDNVVKVVAAAGGKPEQIVVLRAYVTSITEFHTAGPAVGEAWGKSLGKHFPAMTLVEVSKLVDPNAKVEIEAQALLG